MKLPIFDWCAQQPYNFRSHLSLYLLRITATVADPKIIFAAAIKANACGIIISHNHPSGNLSPSQQDIDLTRKVKEGGKILEVQLLDHVIITTESYYSFADEGIL